MTTTKILRRTHSIPGYFTDYKVTYSEAGEVVRILNLKGNRYISLMTETARKIAGNHRSFTVVPDTEVTQ